MNQNGTPLDVYRILICSHAIKSVTGLTSAIDMIDAFQIPAQLAGQVVPAKVIADMIGDGVYEVAFVWRDEGGASYRAGDNVLRLDVRGRFQAISPDIRLPDKVGAFYLTLEFRRADGAWQETAARCPVNIQLVEPPKAAQAQPPTAQA